MELAQRSDLEIIVENASDSTLTSIPSLQTSSRPRIKLTIDNLRIIRSSSIDPEITEEYNQR